MITGGEATVARATAAVFVDGGRAGSAVLVDPRYLVTAAHVLQRSGLGTRPEVGRHDDARQLEQRRRGARLAREHVEGGAGDTAGHDGIRQRLFVEHTTTGGVHDA